MESPTQVTSLTAVYFAVPSEEVLLQIGRAVVEEQLAACVNALGHGLSVYRWKGQLTEDKEWFALAKTSAARADQLISRIKALHPYDCPAIVAFPITSTTPDYLKWVTDQTPTSF